MRVIKTKIQNKPYLLGVAESEDEKTKGLSNTPRLNKSSGMLFVYDKPTDVVFNTAKMNYPIDMIFMDEDWNVVDKLFAEPGEEGINKYGIKYVLETTPNAIDAPLGSSLSSISKDLSGKPKKKEEKKQENIIIARSEDTPETAIFRKGGKVIKPKEVEVQMKDGFMQVLDDTGKILMNIKGGERIFSRQHTKDIVDLVNKIKRGKASLKDLGKYIADVIKTQDTQDPEYVYE